VDHSTNKNSDKSTENPEETHDINALYPPPQRGRGKANAKHLLIVPKLFKEMLMLCQTSRGKRIRRYYVDLEETISLYFKYQCLSENLKVIISIIYETFITPIRKKINNY
jgi:hypothetical protein